MTRQRIRAGTERPTMLTGVERVVRVPQEVMGQ